MLSVSDPGSGPAPCPDHFNLARHVLEGGRDCPDRPALRILGAPDQTWRFGDLSEAVARLACGLQSLDLPPGAPVLLRLGNRVEFPLAFLGCAWAGLLPVPTSAQLTVPEITRIAQILQPALMLHEPGVALPDPVDCPALGLDALQRLGDAEPMEPVAGSPDRPGYIVFTSGTSGTPRGVVHAHRAIWARRMMRNGWTGLGPGDRILHAGAFNWTYTLGTGLLDPWSVGATALVPAPGTPATALPGHLARMQATIFAAAPGIYRQMLRSPMPPLPALRHGVSAGEKLPGPVRDRWGEQTGCAIHEAYGMSECSTFVSASEAQPAPEGALGYPQPGRSVAILGPDGKPVDRGTPGTIAIARTDPGLMLGYLGADDPFDGALSGDGAWFRTGDTGTMLPDGAIRYLGRDDDMMNAGGFRVTPLEVEAAMTGHPAIAEAAAIEIRPKPDATVIALYYTAADPLPEPELAAFAATRLARYKQPRVFVHVAALPRGPNGKLARQVLRRAYEVAHDDP